MSGDALRICLATPDYPPHTGGAARSAQRLVQGLARARGRVLADPDLARHLSSQARATAARLFVSAEIDRYHALYESLVTTRTVLSRDF